MSSKKLFTKIILLVLVFSMGICSTSCDLSSSIELFRGLRIGEWSIALNQQTFSNVTIVSNGDEIKIVKGVAYHNGEKVTDEETQLINIIFVILNNCKKSNFSYDYKNNVYCADEKVFFSFPMEIEGMHTNVNGEASNVILQFNSDKKLDVFTCNIVLKLELLGYENTSDIISMYFSFSNYGTTTLSDENKVF